MSAAVLTTFFYLFGNEFCCFRLVYNGFRAMAHDSAGRMGSGEGKVLNFAISVIYTSCSASAVRISRKL